MKTLEVRRHSHRKAGGGSQLSQAGVTYARELGARIGPFAYVATSVLSRARETAIAMGFAVDQDMVPLLAGEAIFAEIEASRWWDTPQPMAALARMAAEKGPAWRYGASVLALWRDIVLQVPDGASALVITHSGEAELALAVGFPDADHARWGGMLQPCEGVRLTFEGDPERFTRVEFLRGEA